MKGLDEARITKFAQALGVSQAERFLEALQTSDALEFAERPGDLEGLVALWTARKTLGTYELIE